LEPVFVAILSCILGSESRSSLPIILLITGIGILGMLLMIKPDFAYQMNLVALAALVLGNVICSVNHFLTIKLTKQDSILATLMYNIIFVSGILLSSNTILALSGYTFDFKPIEINRIKLISLGFFAATSSWIGLSALNKLDANIHVNIQNLSLPLSVLVGHLEGDSISIKTVIGTLAILVTLFLLEYRKKHRKINVVYPITIAYSCILIFYLTS
jgi:hypothetical protein